jgi:hypothetical protein
VKNLKIAACLFALASLPVLSQPPKPAPDLHAGGPSPSLIPNHEITEVTLPGLHLTGTTLTVDGACSLQSFQVISDTAIKMKLRGNRTITDKDDGCFLHVHQGTKQASTYVVVDLTEAEQQQQNSQQVAAAKTKADAYMAGLGTQWTLHYADGATEVLTAQPADPGQLPDFTSNLGGTTKVMTANGTVMIIAGECVRSGTLIGNQVKDGKVMAGDCKHPGAWTGQKK